MAEQKLTLEHLFDKSLVVAENLRLDFIKSPHTEPQLLINKKFSEFKDIQKSFLKQIRDELLIDVSRTNLALTAINNRFKMYLSE